tara:strand:- start:7 stop:702 length:696 start_codon:yes stop_codon:yes gene_type:complete
MISNTNLLLVGNSRLHWAAHSQKKYKFFHTRKDSKIPKTIDMNNLIWASVGNSGNLKLKKENEIKTKDINLLNLPEYFGVDRAFAGLAVLEIIHNPYTKNLLIADCGTILSLTKLNAKGAIIGGQLAPGFSTQLKSIEQYTKNLKAPIKYELPTEDFLLNTEDAILKGVINSLIGLIDLSFNPVEDILITCGGDSEFITNILKKNHKEVINEPNLVMKWMISHLNQTKNSR